MSCSAITEDVITSETQTETPTDTDKRHTVDLLDSNDGQDADDYETHDSSNEPSMVLDDWDKWMVD